MIPNSPDSPVYFFSPVTLLTYRLHTVEGVRVLEYWHPARGEWRSSALGLNLLRAHGDCIPAANPANTGWVGLTDEGEEMES